MTNPSPTYPAAAGLPGKSDDLSIGAVLFIFWIAFAAAAVFMQVSNPDLMYRTDPDSVLRLVQVRDLLAGQGWFDLVQHRMDPPAGLLMHWSRLVDAPLAALVIIGEALGVDGEAVALTVWPLLLLFAYMAGCAYAAAALAERRDAAILGILLSLAALYPLFAFLPGSIDHHNAQLALTVVTLAAALQIRAQPLWGLAAGLGCSAMLAIGLETLLYVAVFGVVIAGQWALSGRGAGGAGWFGASFAIAPACLFLLTGSPQAATACDSLSWAYALPAALAGLGLAALTRLQARIARRGVRLGGLAVLALLSGSVFLLVAPECRAGPYGVVSPELEAAFLAGVAEAQPLLSTFWVDPARMAASIAAPGLAAFVAWRRTLQDRDETGSPWLLPATLISAAALLSLHQQRAVPYAIAAAVPVLAAWIAEFAGRRGIASVRPIRRAAPAIAAFVLATPVVHYGLGWAALGAVSLATAGRLAASETPAPPESLTDGLSAAERDCLDPASAALLDSVPPGLAMAPLFYGSSLLALSSHSVVAGPYHRAEAAALDTLRALNSAPEDARRIIGSRGVNYVAICAASEEVALTIAEAPSGLLARLIAGESIAWLEPVDSPRRAALRLYRVRSLDAASAGGRTPTSRLSPVAAARKSMVG